MLCPRCESEVKEEIRVISKNGKGMRPFCSKCGWHPINNVDWTPEGHKAADLIGILIAVAGAAVLAAGIFWSDVPGLIGMGVGAILLGLFIWGAPYNIGGEK